MSSKTFTLGADDALVLLDTGKSANDSKRELFNQYIKHFSKLVSGSEEELTMTIHRTIPLTVPDFKPFILPRSSFEFKLGNYIFREGQTYINFANEYLGGGVLKDGFVQEEFILCQSTVLPYLKKLSGFNRIGKNDGSLIAETHIFMDIDPDLYGRVLSNTDPKKIKNMVDLLPKPISILFAGMNAPRNPSYDADLVVHMMSRAYTTFEGSYMIHVAKYGDKPFIVNTGMWGCGAYRNDPLVVFAVQLYAWAMFEMKHPGVKCRLRYHLSDKHTLQPDMEKMYQDMHGLDFDAIITTLLL
jgi:hypothetical protein